MEKLSQIKNKFLKFLPKEPVASMGIQNPSLSPRRPPVSIIPKEARRNHKRGTSFSAKEPSSPKVSCIGQVERKKKNKNKNKNHKNIQKNQIHKNIDSVLSPEKKILLWIAKGNCNEGSKQSGKAFVLEEKESATPTLGTMKKFASGRGTLSDFDFTLEQR
ncbi:uncharacterized protein At1g76070-like [Arachis stenosperma]|uniref:uncharacterized protein At1g76070-like n=1 Tax=Arachis stenosperma TaxID=217475 RepID=UPI0025AC1A04|nr:uncharacterized protein At1g76070-like [Arachis stenosperma]